MARDEVWWGNTLQYFVVVWVATLLLWQPGAQPQLDYYAYGEPQPWPALGGFCEQYQVTSPARRGPFLGSSWLRVRDS